LVSAISAAGAVVVFWPPFPEQAQRWTIERVKRHQKTLTPEAAAWLVQETEPGLRFLDQELQKVCCYVGGRPVITLEDAQAAFGMPRASSPYAWTDAIRRKDPAHALQTLGHLLEEGEEPVRLLAMISGSVRDWLDMKNVGDAPGPAWRFRLKPKEEASLKKDLAGWSEKQLLEGMSDCVEAQLEVKTGGEDPKMALTFLSLRLCGLEGAHPGRQP
jgi:DNA polymerase-3 subunit delta